MDKYKQVIKQKEDYKNFDSKKGSNPVYCQVISHKNEVRKIKQKNRL